MTEEPQPAEAVEIFFSYAHEDEELRRGLEQHFSFLRREGKTVHWHDGEIKAGKDWRGEIEGHLKSADVILLLVSAAYADSDFCYSVELKCALKRHEAGEAVVIPLRLHPCDWQKAPFARLQALPGGDKAISEWANLQKAFYEVAKGVREVVEDILARRTSIPQTAPPAEAAAPSALIPPPPSIDFVSRKDREGRDIVERLREWLKQKPARLNVLWGEGGVGKTTLAAEVARALAGDFGERIVWASAEKSADFTYPTLLNGIATQLGQADLAKLATEPKEQAVRKLLTAAPTLVILDNYETVSPDEKAPCADFLATRAQCPALITTRERVAHAAARHLHVLSMDEGEARQFVERWIAQEAHDPRGFEGLDRDEIIRAADARPYVLQWVLAQINLAMEPRAVLDELARAEGEVGECVFQRSFNLPQLGDDGRAALLALALFTPSASRPALAEVAGFGDDLKRLNEAVKRLAALRLVQTTPGGKRLSIEGLTRSLAQSRLSADERADDFHRRYVTHFLRHSEAHPRPTPEDLDALEMEKDNVLGAMEAALRIRDWDSLLRMGAALKEFLDLRGYWSESGRLAEAITDAASREGNEKVAARFLQEAALIYKRRGEFDTAFKAYLKSLTALKKLDDRLGVARALNQLGRITHYRGKFARGRKLYELGLRLRRDIDCRRGVAISLHNLGMLEQDQNHFTEARLLYEESMKIKREIGDNRGVYRTTFQLAALARLEGKVPDALRLYLECLKAERKLGGRKCIANIFHDIGLMKQEKATLTVASRYYKRSLRIKESIGDIFGAAQTKHLLAQVEHEKHKLGEAYRLYVESLSLFEKLKVPIARVVREELQRLEYDISETGFSNEG